jgi:hypothetical protein
MTTEGLQEMIRESREAGRISEAEENAVQYMIGQYGNEDGLRTLKYFEKMSSISAYLVTIGSGFKMREFYYGSNLPEAEKQKITLALKEAQRIMETDRGMEGSR